MIFLVLKFIIKNGVKNRLLTWTSNPISMLSDHLKNFNKKFNFFMKLDFIINNI